MLASVRRVLPTVFAWTAGALAALSSQESDAARPNVVLLVADDLGTHLGCYGDAGARTPYIDRLAETGVTFSHAYCQATSCNPSRTSFLSGLRPASTGVFENRRWRELDLATLPEHFAEHGYDTVKVGKVFHPMGAAAKVFSSKAKAREWEATGRAAHAERRLWGRVIRPTRARRNRSPDRGPPAPALAGDVEHEGSDDATAEAAARFLRESHERPFLLAVGFAKPHLPFDAPDRYRETFRDVELELPSAPADDLLDVPAEATKRALRLDKSPEEWRRYVQGYYACVAYLDNCVGKVLAALEAEEHRDTIVVLMSDHGQLLGEHNLLRKGVLFEDCLRVPLIVAAPGARRGAACSRIVENVDLLPTLTDLCGIPAPKACEGTSFRPLLFDPDLPWKRAAFSYEPNGTSMRTERWRFTAWESGGVELYDHDTDPREHHNLAGAEEHAETVAALQAMLEGGWRDVLPGAKPR